MMPPGATSWTQLQGYSASSSFTWTSDAIAGVYQLEVWAKDASSTAQYDTTAHAYYTITSGQGCSSVLQGSFTIANAIDVATLSTYCEITGDLSINAPGLSEISLPALQTVGGNITGAPATNQVPDLIRLDLPALSSVQRLDVEASALETVTLTNLTTFSLLTLSSPQLATVDVSSMASVPNANITISGAIGGPLSVTFPNLTNGNLYIQAGGAVAAPKLTAGLVSISASSVDLSALQTSASLSVSVSGNGSETVSFPNLTSAGAAYVTAPPEAVVSMPALKSIGSTGALTGADVNAPLLATVGGNLSINIQATSLNLPALTSAGAIELGYDAQSGKCPSTDGGTSQASIGDPNLVSLNLPLLANVGNVNVGSCPLLPQCRLNALAAGIKQKNASWSGSVIDQCGSQPSSPCP
jgi:hypothetical protein